MTEKEWMATVVAAAKALGWKVFHTHDSRRSEPGFPDLVLARNGALIFAELKTETGKVSRAQEEWLNTLALAGARVGVWRPSGWPLVQEVLRGNTHA